MFDLFGLASGGRDYRALPKAQTLLQKCSCGAQLEVRADAWDPSALILEWLRSHPCTTRVKS